MLFNSFRNFTGFLRIRDDIKTLSVTNVTIALNVYFVIIVACRGGIINFKGVAKMQTLTTGDIAKICDVSLRTVIRWIDRGVLKGYKLPGRGNNRVKKEDFISFLNEHNMPIPKELQKKNDGKILIVDDEISMTKAIQRVLKGAGYETSIANSGFHAHRKLLEERPALMTLDLSLPGLNGYEVIEYVRATQEISDTFILVISALDETSLNQALEYGADAVLQKPFANLELLEIVASLNAADAISA